MSPHVSVQADLSAGQVESQLRSSAPLKDQSGTHGQLPSGIIPDFAMLVSVGHLQSTRPPSHACMVRVAGVHAAALNDVLQIDGPVHRFHLAVLMSEWEHESEVVLKLRADP